MNIFGGREAKDLTAEIDRETDAAVLAEAEAAKMETATRTEQAKVAGVESLAEKARTEAAKTEMHELEQGPGWQAGEVSAQARMLGSAALEQTVIASNEAIKEQVAIENGYVDTGLAVGRNVIGGESEKQVKERIRDDLEDARMEEKVDLPPELRGQAEILSKNQESLAKGTVAAMDQMMKRRDLKPAQLERQAWRMKMKMLETIGRKFGVRN